jgi:hypothetical protein
MFLTIQQHRFLRSYRFYYCHEAVDDLAPAVKLPVLVAWTAVLFAAIAIVADTFFAPAVGRGLHSFPIPLNLSLPCPFPLKLSVLCPPRTPT